MAASSRSDGGYRLPDTLSPSHYNLILRPDIYRHDPAHFIFDGEVTIYINVLKDTSEIRLHERKLNIFDAMVRVWNIDENVEVKIKHVVKDFVREFYTIVLDEELHHGSKYSVYLKYQGPLRKDLNGMYWSSYQDNDNKTRYLVASQLESIDARKVFPCFDEPAFKATFNVTMEYKNSHTTIGNMDVEETTDLGDGWLADRYHTTPIMSSYLLAFIVSDFECETKITSNNKRVSVCARYNAMDQVGYALSIAGDIQEFFERYHDIEYPLPKTVHIAVPDFGPGAMENWGLIIYRESSLLHDEATASAGQRQGVASVISHELAHQWFGNLVTCQWWDDIWLNEGFASYMEYLGVDSQYTDDDGQKYWKMEEQFVTGSMRFVMKQDGLISSHPVYTPIDSPDAQVFDMITYSKGSAVIRMMNYFLSEEIFKKGLTNYLTSHMYGVTSHQDLFEFLTMEAEANDLNINVTEVMNTWVLQTGYPVISAKVKDNKIEVEQKRFLYKQPGPDDTVPDSPYGYKWVVPITYMSDVSSDDTIYWLRNETDSLPMSDDIKWILVNVDQHFYYRVNYELDNWRALFQQLAADHHAISVLNRAQIIDDTFNLGRAGEISQVLALEAAEYMDAEMEFAPWKSLSRDIRYTQLMLQYEPESYTPLQEFMTDKLSDVTASVGWEEDGDVDLNHIKRMMQPLIHTLDCSFGSSRCISNTVALFAELMEGTGLSANLAELVYCYGIKGGDSAEWFFALSLYQQSNVASEQSEIMRSLGCASNTSLLVHYLSMLLDDESGIRQQDASNVIVAVTKNPVGKEPAWTFFVEHWSDYIYPTFGESGFSINSIINGVTQGFSTDEELTELLRFVDDNPVEGAAEKALEQAVENTMGNIEWREQNEEDIVYWLKNRNVAAR